jgi:predicted GH43/DUF377 family glycosyl hydrolase
MNRYKHFQLERHPINPILTPDVQSPWECKNVFNPSVIYHNGLFHMHYRAQGVDWISRIGYALSLDGVHWNRLRNPVLTPQCEIETKGVEDPRVTEINGIFYMAYCGNAPYREGIEYYGNIYPMLARSTNLIDWERIGPMTRGEDNKDHVLFPRKFNGRFCAFQRRRPAVWLAYSDDLVSWFEGDMTEVEKPRADCEWESKYIGMNGVPIETEEGWLCFYHASDKNDVYRIGVMLVDRDDPSTILFRPKKPILWPEEAWEVKGDVPNVIFSNANILVEDTVYVYYGAADHVIGLATAKLDDLLGFVKSRD